MQSPTDKRSFSAILPTPFGALGIIADAERLHEIVFLPGSAAALQPSGIPAEKAVQQLARYLADPDPGQTGDPGSSGGGSSGSAIPPGEPATPEPAPLPARRSPLRNAAIALVVAGALVLVGLLAYLLGSHVQ